MSAARQGRRATPRCRPGFLNSNNYVGTTLQNLIGTATGYHDLSDVSDECRDAPRFDVLPGITVLDGTVGQPFQVTIKIPGSAIASKFKPTGVWHKDDGIGSVPTQLPNCTYDANNVPQPQLTAAGICVGSLVQAERLEGHHRDRVGPRERQLLDRLSESLKEQ